MGNIVKCTRPSCSCLVIGHTSFTQEDKPYCSKACAVQYTDQKCVCSYCDCVKG
ncbi:MAG: metallothionein [Candidatus Dadabacteria bacterium]|nr:metallothionein [Candidatus Dadabacteria bacterium]